MVSSVATMRILVLAEACNPEWPSLPVVVYNAARALADHAEVTLVTHVRNRPALERSGGAGRATIVYLDTEYVAAPLYRLGARIAKRAGVATALRLDSVLWDTSWAKGLAKRILFATYMKRAYDLFLGVGSLTLDYLRAFGVPRERTGLFPYAVDVESFAERSRLSTDERAAFRERLGVPAAARVVLGLAKFNAREAPWDLLRAFAYIQEPDVWLVLAGDGPVRQDLEGAARGLSRVHFPGYVPYPELPALYAASDLFVHPAREERWGVSVQEALACGLPVVASSRVGAGYDLIEVGGNGFVYPAGDGEMLAHRIGEALALDRTRVRDRSASILARWDYAATWRNLLQAAGRLA